MCAQPWKPLFVSMLVYLNEEWPMEHDAETLAVDIDSDTGVFIRPRPSRVLLMDQVRENENMSIRRIFLSVKAQKPPPQGQLYSALSLAPSAREQPAALNRHRHLLMYWRRGFKALNCLTQPGKVGSLSR